MKAFEAPSVYDVAGMTRANVGEQGEVWREYVYWKKIKGKKWKQVVYRIDSPEVLYIKRKAKGDSHRVVDVDGVVHYVPEGWAFIRWKTAAGYPPVAF